MFKKNYEKYVTDTIKVLNPLKTNIIVLFVKCNKRLGAGVRGFIQCDRGAGNKNIYKE